MGSSGSIIFIGAIVSLAVVVWGAFSARRSMAVAVVAVFVAMLTAGCSWYAFAESRSLVATISYGVVALLSLGVAGKHATGSRSKLK